MKRTVLILALCLSVQLNALSAPFVHVHADAGHETEHHDGRMTHRHFASHDTTAHDHHGDIGTGHSQPVEHGSFHVWSAEFDAQFLGGVTAARVTTTASLAEPVSAFRVNSSNPGTPPTDRVGPPIPTPPDISPPPLRGPPR